MTVSGDALPTSRAVVTDDQGRYAFDGLPPGKYVVTTMAEGFEPRSVEVVAGGERPAGAGEYQTGRIVGEAADPLGDRGEHRRRQGVELGRAVEAKHRHVASTSGREMLACGLPVEVDHRAMVGRP